MDTTPGANQFGKKNLSNFLSTGAPDFQSGKAGLHTRATTNAVTIAQPRPTRSSSAPLSGGVILTGATRFFSSARLFARRVAEWKDRGTMPTLLRPPRQN